MDILFLKHKKFNFLCASFDISNYSLVELVKIHTAIIDSDFIYRYHFKNPKITLKEFKDLICIDDRLQKSLVYSATNFKEINEIVKGELS